MLLPDIYKILSYLSFGSILIPLAICILKIKTLNHALRVLFGYVLISLMVEITSLLFRPFYVRNYLIIQVGFTFVEFYSLCYIFYLEFSGKIAKAFTVLLTFIFLISAGVVVVKKNKQMDSIINAIEACIMIVLSIAIFAKIFIERNIPKLKEYSFGAIASGVLIYFAATLVLFLYGAHLDNCPTKEYLFMWGVHNFVNVVLNIFLGVAVWRAKK